MGRVVWEKPHTHRETVWETTSTPWDYVRNHTHTARQSDKPHPHHKTEKTHPHLETVRNHTHTVRLWETTPTLWDCEKPHIYCETVRNHTTLWDWETTHTVRLYWHLGFACMYRGFYPSRMWRLCFSLPWKARWQGGRLTLLNTPQHSLKTPLVIEVLVSEWTQLYLTYLNQEHGVPLVKEVFYLTPFVTIINDIVKCMRSGTNFSICEWFSVFATGQDPWTPVNLTFNSISTKFKVGPNWKDLKFTYNWY